MNTFKLDFGSLLSLLPLILAAIAQQSATVPFSVGGPNGKHFLIQIVRNADGPGHTRWTDALGIVLHVLQGQPGSFTVGVFSVTLTALNLSGAAPATASVPGPGVPPAGFAPGPR